MKMKKIILSSLLLNLMCVAFLAGCTSLPIVGSAEKKVVQAWVTTGDKKKLLAREQDANFDIEKPLVNIIDVDASKRFQEMIGFGAALTDASAWLIQTKMSEQQRSALMQELFGRSSGIGLSFTRLTIGASDYSRSHYSFDDVPMGQTDPNLKHFSIDPNRADVLPVLKSALAINPNLHVMATPWSAPAWMKSSSSLIKGNLKPEAYDVYAKYLKRYIDAYSNEGVSIFALTIQNEPHFEPENYPGMRMEPAARANFIGNHLGPLLRQNNPSTKIFDWDHNWDEPQSPMKVLSDPVAASYIDGIAWHCYAGDVKAQSIVHDAYPGKDTYFTECSGGEWAPVWADNLQFFMRTLVIGSTQAWAKGILLWNLALDQNFGPHLGGCDNCRGVVTINSNTGEVTRNVEYYALAHASKFVRQGAQRIKSSGGDGLESVAFRNADDGSLVLIVANPSVKSKQFSVRQNGLNFQTSLEAKSVATYVWKQ